MGAAQAQTAGLPAEGLAVIGIYLAALLSIGLRTAQRQRTTAEFFLAGRRLPWAAVAMSMYASVTSAVTFMGVPAQAWNGNLSLLLVGLVSVLVAPVLARRILPAYRRAGVTTSYEFLELRMGRAARDAAATLFVAARVGWLGLVVYAPALALSTATGLGLGTSIALIGGVATLYTALGGLAAVVWTDTVQFAVMVGGLIWIGVALAGGDGAVPEAIGAAAAAAAKGSLADWRWDPRLMNAPAVLIAYVFILLHEYGVDQVTVQRLLAVSGDRGVARAVAFNAATDVGMIAALLFVGLALRTHLGGELPAGVPADALLPWFAAHRMPPVAGGLLLAAIFAAAMSSMDSGLSSVVAVALNDLWPRRLCRTETQRMRAARWGTLGLGLLATAASTQVARIGDLVRAFYTFAGMFSGPVLALFLLALGRRPARFGIWVASTVTFAGLALALRRTGACHELYLFPLGVVLAWTPAWLAAQMQGTQSRSAP